MKHLWLMVCLSALAIDFSYCQKTLKAYKIEQNIKIDGVLDELEWQKSDKAYDFIEAEPNPGIKASQQTEVRILYDNTAIYVAAKLIDSNVDSILMELSQRDRIGNTDWFAFILDPYKDGINGLGFVVTTAGVQYDVKYSALNSFDTAGDLLRSGDRNWNAVWNSAVKINDDSWVVEIKIPYSAIRFPQVDQHKWHVNFARMLRRSRQLSFWTSIDPEAEGIIRQSGTLENIQQIKSPLRLSATPFLATYVENYYDKSANPSSNWGRSFNAGMDIKYGVNDAFTLDMTLIPDFGQVQSDNEVLNLSPFEIRFEENRQFFTEGTELFNKADLFYSRRVGGRPLYYGDVEEDLLPEESILSNPQTSQLYNAIKFSGRTKRGLGVGFFNATSAKTYANIESIDGPTRSIETNPLTNYNVMVLDQNLKNNSYVTFINTNVWRQGKSYEANVTGTEYLLQNKNNTYALGGVAALSQKYYSETSNDFGYQYNVEVAKTSGNIQFDASYEVVSDDYDQGDLGFLLFNNFRSFQTGLGYNIFKPFGRFNRARTGLSFNYNRLYNPNVFTNFGIGWESFFFTRKFFAFGFFANLEPKETFDYYEPRTTDFSKYYEYPKNYGFGAWISSDYRKKFAIDIRSNIRNFNEPGRVFYNLVFSPRFRASNKLSFILSLIGNYQKNDIGYTGTDDSSLGIASVLEEDVIFGRRNQTNFENVLTANYNFNNKMGINFRARHYWSKVEYVEHNLLGDQGGLLPTTYTGIDINGNSLHNANVNIFNIDMVYNWRFAPGSDLFIVWKNQIFNFNSKTTEGYISNIGNLPNLPQLNSISIKMVYFLDYLYLRRNNLKN